MSANIPKKIDVTFHVGFITADTLINDLKELPPGAVLKFVTTVNVYSTEVAILRFHLPILQQDAEKQ